MNPPRITETWLAALRVPERPDEIEAKQLLARYGIEVPAGRRLEPASALEPLPESPAGAWILKVCSPEILHKTEAGAVLVGLSREELAAEVQALRERVPGTDLLVEEQVRYSGTELILGAVVDPALGPAVMVGAGGVLTELYRDVSFRLAPCSLEECRRMLGELTISPVLQGYRGIVMDAEALARAINRIGCIAFDLGERFRQLDVNPIVFAGGRWVALDAKIVLG
jgi:succinyl-CoA synthetase beta subunit